MEIFRAFIEEQQAVSLVALGLLSLLMARSFSCFIRPAKALSNNNKAFWLSQAILASSGLSVILCPTSSFASAAAAALGSPYLLLYLDRHSRTLSSELA